MEDANSAQVASSRALGARANELWDAGEVDGWLALFRDDARFSIPGDTAISGDHDKAAMAAIAKQLMSARGTDSGRWVIEQYASVNGTSTLMDQKVAHGGREIHYHAMDCYEFRPDDFTKFAGWMFFPHEFANFVEAWSATH